MKQLIALLFCMLLPTMAASDSSKLPWLFDVTGVASDDMLNVRSGPGASHQKVGALSHDAKNVEIIALSANGAWGLTNILESSGWVSMRYLSAVPEDGYNLTKVLNCFGNEPFWHSVITQGQSAVFDSQDGIQQFEAGLVQSTQGRPDRFWLRGRKVGSEFTAVIRRASCNDGMSDRMFGLDMDLMIESGGDVVFLSGCCSMQR